MAVVPPYSRYAEIYDQTGQSQFGLRMRHCILTLVVQQGWQGRRILDLACGTGAVATAWAREGYEVIGVDLAAEMLRQARLRARRAGVKVHFWQQDMRTLSLNARVDLVTCFYDSLNYLLSFADLCSVFSRIAAILSPGGFWAFDLNTLFALSHHWEGLVDACDDDEVAYIWQCCYDPATCISALRATFFVRRGDLYEKFVEVHKERGYSHEEVLTALQETGFTALQAYEYPSLKPPHPESTRLLYLARKPGLGS